MAGQTLSLRLLWKMYKGVMAPEIRDRREQIMIQNAFYSGARATLKVLNFMIESDETHVALRTIQRHARMIKAVQGQRQRARRH